MWQKASSDLAPTWEKAAQKTVQGVLVDKREHVGQFDSSVFTIEQEGGKKVAVWAKGILEQQIKPMLIGTMVKITWKGLVKTKSGRNANAYDVEFDTDTVPQDQVAEAEKILGAKK
jgi:hypothetical protein